MTEAERQRIGKLERDLWKERADRLEAETKAAKRIAAMEHQLAQLLGELTIGQGSAAARAA